MSTFVKYKQERIPGPAGRDAIEAISMEDARLQINSLGAVATQNAYGEIVAEYDDGKLLPVICGHGGSMWLCRACGEELIKQQQTTDSPT